MNSFKIINMKEEKRKFKMSQIFCLKCNEIKKIRINSDLNLKSITVEFECGHERNNQLEYEENKYCLICRKIITQELQEKLKLKLSENSLLKC